MPKFMPTFIEYFIHEYKDLMSNLLWHYASYDKFIKRHSFRFPLTVYEAVAEFLKEPGNYGWIDEPDEDKYAHDVVEYALDMVIYEREEVMKKLAQ